MSLADVLMMAIMWVSVLGWVTILLLITVGMIGGLVDLHRHYRDVRHRARTKRGLCICCGYDLRSTPRRCPECGLAVVSFFAAEPQP